MKNLFMIFLILFLFLFPLVNYAQTFLISDLSECNVISAGIDTAINQFNTGITDIGFCRNNKPAKRYFNPIKDFTNDPDLWISMNGQLIMIAVVVILFIIIISFVSKLRNLNKEVKNISEVYKNLYRNQTVKLRKDNKQYQKEIEDFRKLEKKFKNLQKVNDDLKELSEKQRQLQEAVENMKLGVTITDIEGSIKYTNTAFSKMLGYKSSELFGKNMKILIPEVLGEPNTYKNKEVWQNMIKKNAMMKKDGNLISIQSFSNLIYSEKGKPVAIVTSAEDITERSKSEDALRTSEENFRRIFDNIQDIYYEVDIDGTIKEISPSIKFITGITREELIGNKMASLYFDVKQRNNFVSALKKEINVNDYEIALKGKDNTSIPCTITAKLILDQSKIPSKIIGSVRNITERKRAEDKRAKSMKELKIANKELTDFAYITSHDLTSPLRAINTIATWIMSDYGDKFDDQGKEQMNLLIGRAKRMHHLINGIYEFTNIINFTGEKISFDMNTLVKDTIGRMKLQDNFYVEIKNQLPVIFFEKTRMEQIFENLIDNAVKFMDKDKGLITIGCQETRNNWEFYVADNGPGIAKKYQDKVFQIFQTLNTRDELESTGIGLAIVNKIITKHNGSIWIESEPEQGTTFFFTLPKKEIIKK